MAMRWIRSQFSKVTWTGIVMIVWSFIPDTISRENFWHDSLVKLLKFSLTPSGRFGLLVIGIGLIVLDKFGLLRSKHNLKTLSGRTLKLHDDIDKFMRKAPPKPQFGTVSNSQMEEMVAWSERIRCGFKLHFSERLDSVYLEFGEKGLLPGLYIRNDTYTWNRLKEIVSELEQLAKTASDKKD